MDYSVLAYYALTPIADPHLEVARHKEFFQGRDLKSRIYISEQGINGQMSGSGQAAEEYMKWLQSDERFASVSFKITPTKEHAFPKTTIKYRRQLVALDCDVDISERGRHVSPAEWRAMLEARESDTLVLDVRNTYESAVGHFEGAERPTLETFREFPEYAKRLSQTRDPKRTKLMMYCTGGIRCEFYSALLKKEGFEDVVQLDGGVIQYGEDEGQRHWKGKLFVFDDRLVVPISEEPAPAITQCTGCGCTTDVYYNCANMDCNALFVSCVACVKERQGCCCTECLAKGRVRPLENPENPKPFRKRHGQEVFSHPG